MSICGYYVNTGKHRKAAAIYLTGRPCLVRERQTYEFWLIRNGQAMPAGTFNVSAGGSGRILVQSSEPLGQFDQAGITVEKAGGSPTPTLEALVVVGSLR
jgi:anti-sigma-K factor RskA